MRQHQPVPTNGEDTHLFEAEGHGEHTDAHDTVHHVHDESGVRRRHFEQILITNLNQICLQWSGTKSVQYLVLSCDSSGTRSPDFS